MKDEPLVPRGLKILEDEETKNIDDGNDLKLARAIQTFSATSNACG
jgi:hypothetical protein